MSDLISRCELFNRLATIPAPPEANDFKAKIYAVIQGMETTDRPHSDDWEKYSDKLWKIAYERGKADRPQGEWIFDPEILCSDIGVYSAGYRCSICGKDYFKVDGIRFCSSCGARMKGADDE